MKAIETITGPVSRARPRRRRHRPDHPQAVPQAGRAHRLRRVPVLRLGQGARLGPAGATRSSSPGATSAAARAASTRRGRSRTTASGRSSRRASPTSSTPTARRSACCRSQLPDDDVRGDRRGRRGRRSTSPPRRSAGDGRHRALRDRPRDQAPPAQRPRRHRADARSRPTRSTPTSATASAPARSRRRLVTVVRPAIERRWRS